MDLVSDSEWFYRQDLTKRFTGVNCRFKEIHFEIGAIPRKAAIRILENQCLLKSSNSHFGKPAIKNHLRILKDGHF